MTPPRDFAERVARLRQIVRQRLEERNASGRRRRLPARRVERVLCSDDPRLSSVLRSADELETTVSDLLGEPPVGEADLQKLREFVAFLDARFDLTGRTSRART